MTTPETSRQQLASALAAEARAVAGDRSGPEAFAEETLLVYLDGTLPADEQDRLQERLAASPEGTAKLLQLATLAAAEPPATPEEREDAARGLRALHQRLAAEGGVTPFPQRRQRRFFRAAVVPGLAAALAAMLVAVIWLGPQLRHDARPVLIANVRPALAGVVVRATGEERYPAAGPGPEVPLMPGETGEVVVGKGETVYLKLSASRKAPSCSARVALPDGKEAEVTGLAPDRSLVFVGLQRPRPGSYEITLRCGEVGGPDLYSLVVRMGVVRPGEGG